MKANKTWFVLGFLGCLALVTGACADRSASPERFGDEGEETQAGKIVEKDPAEGDLASTPTPGPAGAAPSEVKLASGANVKLVDAKKLLGAGNFEDLLGLIEPNEAQELADQDKAQLADLYYSAAHALLTKRKDVSFSSMFCERGLLVAPDHQGLLRLQVYNYMHPEMNLVSGAEELVEKLVQVDPEDLENQFLRGKVAFEQADWDTAVVWLKKAARVGRTQGGKTIEQAWKLLDLAKGHQEEMRSALSMTRELEVRMKRAKIVAQSKAVKDAAAEGGSEAGEAADPSGGRIVLFMTRWCKYCAKTRTLLEGLKVKFEEKDIEKDQSALMEMMQAAQAAGVEVRGVPVVQIGSKLVVGYNEALITSLVNKIR
jgi:glutaredoxin